MLLGIWIGIGIVVLLIITFASYYNRFTVLTNRIENSLSQINVQLKRRADLIPNLVDTVKGFAKHEKVAIKAVTDARKALVSAKGIEKKVKANNQLESALKTIFAIAEGYPDLKEYFYHYTQVSLLLEFLQTEGRRQYLFPALWFQFRDNHHLFCPEFPGKDLSWQGP